MTWTFRSFLVVCFSVAVLSSRLSPRRDCAKRHSVATLDVLFGRAVGHVRWQYVSMHSGAHVGAELGSCPTCQHFGNS